MFSQRPTNLYHMTKPKSLVCLISMNAFIRAVNFVLKLPQNCRFVEHGFLVFDLTHDFIAAR